MQPLAETQEALRKAGLGVNMQLAETWMRVYQVLPARTHPNMSMDGASGYVLSGVRVFPDTSGIVKRKKEDKKEKQEGEEKGKKRKSSDGDVDPTDVKVIKTEEL